MRYALADNINAQLTKAAAWEKRRRTLQQTVEKARNLAARPGTDGKRRASLRAVEVAEEAYRAHIYRR